jgi:hypothetical protein
MNSLPAKVWRLQRQELRGGAPWDAIAEQQRAEEGMVEKQRSPRLLDADLAWDLMCEKHKLASIYS